MINSFFAKKYFKDLLENDINGVHFKLSLSICGCGRWRHRPQRAALAGVPTSQRQFEMHPINAFKIRLSTLQQF
mgnify:CR=1 FL=1